MMALSDSDTISLFSYLDLPESFLFFFAGTFEPPGRLDSWGGGGGICTSFVISTSSESVNSEILPWRLEASYNNLPLSILG
ncbi:hypothetical protein AYI68_g8321 [Smittium mucronatum]|uniref:Uncharacterized protein n=1 Tax=Smittium mucronatum TaxID=133383 RepID=A0A1R0GL87_9FUNG|nr:hypothetical protein AYI68_g8321 [Smittium mucronatum]